MERTAAKNAKLCLMCFETRPLKLVGRCRHSYCNECLSIVLGSERSEVFACPSCKVECPRPWNGVDGLVDWIEEVPNEDILVEPPTVVGMAVKNERRNKEKNSNVEKVCNVTCTICHHRGQDVQAKNLCIECDHLHMCVDCTKVHGRNRATRAHIVVGIKSDTKNEEELCKMHQCLLSSYCHDCENVVCMVCVMLDHGEHTVEKLETLVDAKVSALKFSLESKMMQLEELQELKKKLSHLMVIATTVDKHAVLFVEIEDHAQRCINEIIKWKENLMVQVKEDHRIATDISVEYRKVGEAVQILQGSIDQALGLLAKKGDHWKYLDQLTATKLELDTSVDNGIEVDADGYETQLYQLHMENKRFIPVEISSSLGDLVPTVDAEYEIFTHIMPANYITCIANLGESFAVGLGVENVEYTVEDIHMYDFNGELQYKLGDITPPFYDISPTPDGKLAVLSNGKAEGSCSVKVFDPQTRKISCTRDFHVTTPLSLGVTLQHQYIILGVNEIDEKQITIVDKEGQVQHVHQLRDDFKLDGELHVSSKQCSADDDDSDRSEDNMYVNDDDADQEEYYDADDDANDGEDDQEEVYDDNGGEDEKEEDYDYEDDDEYDNDGDDERMDNENHEFCTTAKRIACGGQFIYVLGDSSYALYKFDDGKLRMLRSWSFSYNAHFILDITANVWGDHILAKASFDRTELLLVLEQWIHNKATQSNWGLWKVCELNADQYDWNTRVSEMNNNTIVSHGGTVTVMKR